jgi:guanylate kinase
VGDTVCSNIKALRQRLQARGTETKEQVQRRVRAAYGEMLQAKVTAQGLVCVASRRLLPCRQDVLTCNEKTTTAVS